MATWRKVIVSGSNAELNQITASGGINATLPNSQQANFVTFNTTTNQFGYFGTGSLTATTASYITSSGVNGPFGANSILTASYATTASFVTQAVSASFAQTASFVLNAVSASFATNATNATNTAVTDTTNGAGPYYVTFVLGTTGNQAQLVDSNGLTYNATTNTLTTTASFATLAQTANTASYAITAQTASYVNGNIFTSTNPATSASYALSSSFALTSPAGNLTGATLASNVLTSSLTSLGTLSSLTATNATITNNLIVQGTASFQNTTNLEVADRFVLFASGSNTTGDGGIVVQQGTQNVGELYGYDSTTNRWAFTSSFAANQSAFTPAAYITTTEVGASAPTAAPIYGGSGNGSGNIYVTTGGDIYIYTV
jgi:hypothetical protein